MYTAVTSALQNVGVIMTIRKDQELDEVSFNYGLVSTFFADPSLPQPQI